MKGKVKMKKILSLVLSVLIVFGMTSVAYSADASAESITIYLSVSENGEFVTSPVTNEKMVNIPVKILYFDLAEYGLEAYYRYEADSFENGGAYINETVVEQPTLMHLFIKAVEDYYIGAEYNGEENADALSFAGNATSAYATTFFGHDSNFTYLVDNSMPQMTEGWGASCDYILLEDEMEVEICMFSSWNWAYSGSVASFESKEMTAYSGGSLNFSIKGDPLFSGGSEQIELDGNKVFVVKSTQLDWENDETAEYVFEADQDGVFNVRFDEVGEFYVTAVDVNVGSEDAEIAPAVCKVTVTESEPLPDYDGYWTSFRGNKSNMAIVDAKIPKNEDVARLKWAEQYSESWMDNTTPPIIVEDSLYFAKNDKILKVSTEDGSLLQESEALAGNIGFGTTSITYGGGMFYVPVGSGQIQALRADTLESVWLSEPLGGQTITPVTYMDGKVYCGTWSSEDGDGSYFCLTAEDEDTNQKSEIKPCLWKISHRGGFYWAGAYATDSFVVFGSDDGEEEGAIGESVIFSVNPETGEIIDTIDGVCGDIRSCVSYDEQTDRIYFTSKGGWFCKAKVNEDGTFEDADFESFELGGASTVTPLVYDGLAYVGVTSSEQFGNGGNGYKIIDVNAVPMKEVASAEVPGSVQSCALMTTAYENKGRVYVYITYNNIPGGIFELAVKKTDERDADGAAIVNLDATELFVPEDDMAQFCICSPICDEKGTIYYKNDSGYLMAVRRKASSVASGGSGGGGASNGGGTTRDNEHDEKEQTDTSEEVSVPETVPAEEPKAEIKSEFEDIKGHWAEEFVNALYAKGIINGKSEKLFDPDGEITRAEFIALLFRISGEDIVFEPCFDDVKEADWFGDAVCWAVKCGITSGTAQNMFSPELPITREMAVVFAERYLNYKNIKPEVSGATSFADNQSISEWAKKAVALIQGTGIISGKGDGLFKPLDNVTRAESSKILIGMIGVIEKNEN